MPMQHDHAGHTHGPGHGHGHGHGHSHDHAHGSDRRRVLWAAVLTGSFMVAEAVGGVLTGSLALIADAAHMLTDTVALAMAWYAFTLASRAATARMTYGFDRFKTLVAYTNGLAIFVIGGWIVVEAFERFNNPVEVLGGPMLVVALLGLLVNAAAFLILHGGDRDSLNMRGAILHVVGDLLGSVAALLAAAIILVTGWMAADPILSVLVSLLLFRSAWALVRESGHMLLEGVPGAIDRDAVARDLEQVVPGVVNVHHMHVWSLDGQRHMATLHALLAAGTDSPQAIGAIKQRLAAAHGIDHATVETEFDACADGV